VTSLSTTSSFLNTEQRQAVDDVNGFINGLSPGANSLVLDDVREPTWSSIEVQLDRAPSVLDLAEDPLNRMSVLSQGRNLDIMKWWCRPVLPRCVDPGRSLWVARQPCAARVVPPTGRAARSRGAR